MPLYPPPASAYGSSLARAADSTAALALLNPFPRLLFKSNIPFIIPSSGTMGDNGAVSGLTSMTFTWPRAYAYFPANAIAAGVAAGWYYTTFSSATAGTVFNNVYDPTVGGEPTVPASPTAFATTGPGAFTQAVEAGRQGPSFTLPAGTLGANGRIRVDMGARCPTNANVKSVTFRQGTTALPIATTLTSSTGANITIYLEALGATNSQAVGSSNSIGGTAQNQPPSAFALNFANDLAFNAFPLIANAADYMALAYMRVWQEA